jgi:outer membrane lipase/esterase
LLTKRTVVLFVNRRPCRPLSHYFVQEQFEMRTWKYALSAIGAALLVAACGGGGGSEKSTSTVGFSSMVSFGDSLSDIGTYKVGAVAAVGGGKWTVNSATAKNWTELIAAQFGLATPCPAQTGLLSIIPGFTGAPVQNFAACRSYAQGSSRVTSQFGPNSIAIQQAVLAQTGSGTAAAQAAGLGLMAQPVATQMATHLTNVGGSYGGRELVTVMAGGNDVFLNLNGVSSAAAGGAGAVGAATFAGWSAGVQATVAAGGATAVQAASQAAVAGMAQAANELVALVNTQVLAKGARYVVVVNLPDVSTTPFAASLDANTRGLINTMVTTFNSQLSQGLVGKAGVIVVDAYTQGRDQVNNPSQYTLTNTTTAACSKNSPANPLGGSSITCTAGSLIAGDTSKYLFADDVHLTPFGYELLAQFVTKNMATAGWL